MKRILATAGLFLLSVTGANAQEITSSVNVRQVDANNWTFTCQSYFEEQGLTRADSATFVWTNPGCNLYYLGPRGNYIGGYAVAITPATGQLGAWVDVWPSLFLWRCTGTSMPFTVNPAQLARDVAYTAKLNWSRCCVSFGFGNVRVHEEFGDGIGRDFSDGGWASGMVWVNR